MANIQLLPTQSPGSPQQPLQISESVTLGEGQQPNSPDGSQVWFISGCAYVSGAGGMKADVTLTCGTTVVTGMLQRYDNVSGAHAAWPPLVLASAFPQNSVVTLTITGQTDTDWTSNDWVQIAVVEMDHTGLGGGL